MLVRNLPVALAFTLAVAGLPRAAGAADPLAALARAKQATGGDRVQCLSHRGRAQAG